MKNQRVCEVIKGEYKGRLGIAKETSVPSNIMFYSKEGQYPYRVCLERSYIKFLD